MSLESATKPGSAAGRRWRFASCEYVEISRQLFVKGEPAKLEPIPLQLLQILLEEPAKVHIKDQLIGQVWPKGADDQSLVTAISKLRKALGGSRDDIIVSVSKIGYRMAVPVTCVPDVESSTPTFQLRPGDPIPGRANWFAAQSIGVAGGTSVWIAVHAKTKEARVFKFALDGVRLSALQREVDLSRYLQQALPHDERFVRILDWDLQNLPFWVETEYSGRNLFEWSQTEGFSALGLSERIALMAEIAEAVGAAHALGILHNDLKPSNVLVSPKADLTQDDLSLPGIAGNPVDWKIKIADLGIATLSRPERLLELQITYHEPGADDVSGERSRISGSAQYRPPESLAGAVPSAQGDVYALGVMLYQIACGDFLASLSPGWENKIQDLLLRQDIADAANVDPALRIQSATQLASRLRTIEARRREDAERRELALSFERAQRTLAAARVRRPWVIFAAVILTTGLVASTFFYRRAALERDIAKREDARNAAMFHFLADDLLAQSNPSHRGSGAGPLQQETLIEAIDQALPMIDRQFEGDPEVAGQLHETIAESFQNQTRFLEADAEYRAATRHLIEAEGPQGQSAIVAELKRESSQIKSGLPGALEKAKLEFAIQQQTAARIARPGLELHAWLALTQADLAARSSHPEQGLPVLNQEIQEAESTGELSPATLYAMRQRLFDLYLQSGNGPKAEEAARGLIAARVKLNGPESPAVLMAEMNLHQALLAQKKYKETVEAITATYPQFVRLLGPANMYTLQSLATRAAAEGELKDYDNSIRDDLAVYQLAKSNASAKMLQVTSIADAAMSECRTGRISAGVEHARQAYLQTTSEQETLPGLQGGSAFTLAECLLAERETSGSKGSAGALAEVRKLLDSIDVASVAQFSVDSSFPGSYDLAEARLALANGNLPVARQMAQNARPYFQAPNADPYEKELLLRLDNSLAIVHSTTK